MGSYHDGQAGLELLASSDHPKSASQIAGIIGVSTVPGLTALFSLAGILLSLQIQDGGWVEGTCFLLTWLAHGQGAQRTQPWQLWGRSSLGWTGRQNQGTGPGAATGLGGVQLPFRVCRKVGFCWLACSGKKTEGQGAGRWG